MSSSRLPGKVLADVGGEPALALLLHRLSRAETLGQIIVATSTDEIDDPIVRLATERGFGAGRGSRDDVLGRIVGVIADQSGPIVRITGDCPLIDPGLVDQTVELFLSTPGCRYASNIDPRRFPDGLDVEVVDAGALREVAAEARSSADREHVTLAIRRDHERFASASVAAPEDLGSLNWTVDVATDLEFVRAVVGRIGPRRYDAGMREILNAVRQTPSLAEFGEVRRG